MVSKKLLYTVQLPSEVIKVKAFGYEKDLLAKPAWELRGHKLTIFGCTLNVWEFEYGYKPAIDSHTPNNNPAG